MKRGRLRCNIRWSTLCFSCCLAVPVSFRGEDPKGGDDLAKQAKRDREGRKIEA